MNSESVDLIYLDPPFNSNRTYSAPIGSKAAGAAFKDAWTLDDADRIYLALLKDRDPKTFAVIEAARLAHGKGMAAYIGMMAQRLAEMRRVLKPTGSIYLHCDPYASHYLKILMDGLFGQRNHRNEIVWCYTGPGSPKMRQFNRKHDTIHWYSAGDTWVFNSDDVRIAHKDGGPHTGGFLGQIDDGASDAYGGKGKIPETWWAQEKGNGLAIAARQKVQYVGYPTQKPLALLDRIIRASSNEGDVVLDPFCGCATAAVAAERLGRQWIGIDISPKAAELVTSRLNGILDEVPLYKDGSVVHRTDQPRRTDMGALPKPRSHMDLLWGRQSGLCGGCGVRFEKRNMTVDHIVPRTHGGTDHLENLWLLCGACNSSKGTLSQEQFLRKRMKPHAAAFPWLVERA